VLNAIIRFSLVYRTFVVVGAALLLILGSVVASRTPVDVLPDLTAPTVTVITEAPGLAPEEVETLVTFPLESALNGAPDVRRLRSISGAGVSFIWVEFEWGQEVYLSRQIVSERLQEVRLPEDVRAPRLGPLSSIMGEITFIALTSETLSEKELRLVAETDVRRALLSISGIAQVIPIGGEKRQYQVELDAVALAQHAVTPDEVAAALRSGSSSAAAGFHAHAGQEYVVRGLGRVRGTRDLAATVIKVVDGIPLTVADLATVHDGAEPRRGTAAYSTRPAVILSVLKQPGANTLELTRQIDLTMEELSQELPEGVVVEKENFRQADFIEVAIRNVSHALRDGALLVVLMLFLFLGNLRSTLIAAVAIPLSLVSGVLVISAFGATVNTMTLGGLTIAIGALVDDAIITVENVFRTLRLEREVSDEDQRPDLEVVYAATVEVVGPIVYATLIICLVFVPLFVLPGMEGRLMFPLGLAYVSALATSLLVSLTLTPALCSFLLPRSSVLTRRTPWLLRGLLSAYQPTVAWALRRPRAVLVAAVTAIVAALAVVPLLGRSFLPAFNEGALTVAVASAPGITLEESDALGREVEATLLSFPEVVSTSRRTGRAERDEHLQGEGGRDDSRRERHLRSADQPPHRPHDLRQQGQPRREALRIRPDGAATPGGERGASVERGAWNRRFEQPGAVQRAADRDRLRP